MSPATPPAIVAVALEGCGWHPAAWRLPDARPDELFGARYWVDLVTAADRAGVDVVTFGDALRLQSHEPRVPDRRTDEVRGRLDAVLMATRVAPLTRRIGLMPTVTTSQTEPFHAAKAIATLDHVSGGRAGVQIRVGGDAAEERHVGRGRSGGEAGFRDAADYVEVLRRLWDSWEDDAEIRDVASGRFVDREKLHHIDFQGETFSVRGPSITPRSPQGQPLVAALGHVPIAYRLIARTADLAFVTPHSIDDVAPLLDQIAAEDPAAQPQVLADVVVLVENTTRCAGAALAELDEIDPPAESDALVVADTPDAVADLIEQLHLAGLQGVRLRPARLPRDLDQIIGHVLPRLVERGLWSPDDEGATLRERLGHVRPASRYSRT